MIDRLRMWLNRPLRDGDRRQLFLAAVTVILAVAGVLALVNAPSPRPERATRSSSPAPPHAQPAVVAVQDSVSLVVPSEEGSLGKELEGSRADVTATKRAARRFLAGYLSYTYGRRSAGRIASASVRLRRRLAARPPRVPARERLRHPRVVLVQSNAVGRVRAELVALVRDGGRHYTVPLELSRGSAGWNVTAVGS